MSAQRCQIAFGAGHATGVEGRDVVAVAAPRGPGCSVDDADPVAELDDLAVAW